MGEVKLSAQDAQNLLDHGNHHSVGYLRSFREAIAAKVVAGHLVFRSTDAVRVNQDVPNVFVIFDVVDGGVGPSGFHQKLIDDLANVAVGVIVVTKFDSAAPYEQSVALAVQSRGAVILVETVEDRSSEWLALVNTNQQVGIWSLWSGEVAGRA